MENNRIKYLFELHDAFKTKDIVSQLSHFKMLTNSLFTLTQSLFDSNEKIKYFHSELENKYFRYGIANHSISNLMTGNEFKLITLDVKITDLFSIFSLTRMQIESYALMFYLFYDDVPENEKNFRYNIYKLHGLIKQSKFNTTSEKGIEKKNKILTEIESLKETITEFETFKNSSLKEQTNFLKPKRAVFLFSKDLLAKSGLESSRIDEMWDLYSNYAHSEYISDRQFNSIYKINKSTLEETLLALNINSIMTARLCTFLTNSFQGVKQKYTELDIKERVHIETWNKLYN
jgi:hypothetical protein